MSDTDRPLTEASNAPLAHVRLMQRLDSLLLFHVHDGIRDELERLLEAAEDEATEWAVERAKPEIEKAAREAMFRLKPRPATDDILASPALRAAVDEGLADVAAGRTTPWPEVKAEMDAAEKAHDARIAAEAVAEWRNLAMLAVALSHVTDKHKSKYHADCLAPLCDDYRRLTQADKPAAVTERRENGE